MARRRYWVVPEWDVKHNGRVLSHHYLKSAAVDAGSKAAKANRPSQLTVLKLDGTIEYEHTYDGDPYPPAG